MAVSVTCPGCRTSYPVTDDLLGKKIRCKKCQETFTAAAGRNGTARAGDERIQTRPGAAPAAARRGDDDGPGAPRGGRSMAAPGAKAGNHRTVVIFAAVAGALLAGMGALLAWALLFRTPEPVKDNSVTNVTPPPQQRITPAVVPDKPTESNADPVDQNPTPAVKPVAGATTVVSQDSGNAAMKVVNELLQSPQRPPRPADFRPGVIEKAKRSAVLIKCTAENGMGTGSGWVAEQNGQERYIVTNAHVVFMKEPVKPPPEKIEVVFHAGTPEERSFEGKLLALDREEDLAVLRVKGPDLPEPLTMAPSHDLVESERLTTLGFPKPDYLKMIFKRGLGFDALIQVRARPTAVAGRVPNKDGSIKFIQIEGGVDPGNSGGATIDTNGHVVAVVDAQAPGTNMKFVIPSEYVVHLLHGRVLRVVPSQSVVSGGMIRQPLHVMIADPMQRVTGVSADVWAGKVVGGLKVRPPSGRAPDPQEGDRPRVRVALSYNPEQTVRLGESHVANGEAQLPLLKDGEVYWFQPRYVGKDGKERWGEAVIVEMGRHPVEARPANLTLRHKADVKPDEKRTAVLYSHQVLGLELEGLGNLGQDSSIQATLTERTRSVEPNGDAKLRLQYVDLSLSDKNDDSLFRKELRGVLESAKRLGVEVTLTRDGRYRSPIADKHDVPQAARQVLDVFNRQILNSLEAMALSLPNKDVQPGETWNQATTHSIMFNQRVENALLRMTCRYIGTRTRDGRAEAVIEMTGQVARSGNDSSGGGQPAPGDGAPAEGRGGARRRGVTGDAIGAACVDLQTGQVTLARIESELAIDSELQLRNPETNRPEPVRVIYGLYIDVVLRRSLTSAAPKEVKDLAEFLPNQVKVYNPLIGAAPSVTAEVTAPRPSGVPTRATLMSPEVFDRVKKAAVLLRVVRADGPSEGSGFFAEPGLVVTNCHVVGMLQKTDRVPEKIEVVLDVGTDRERKLPGQLLAVDRDDDLAVVRVLGDKLPEPLRTAPAASLTDGQRLQVIGFPHGSGKVKDLEKGLGVRNLQTSLSARPTTVVGRVPKADQSIKFVQLEGGADHGNSGGAIVDAEGNVRLVLVAGIPGTDMRFGIPGEYLARLLQGYPLEVTPGRAYLDGSAAKQPVAVKVSDPMKRVRTVSVDVWVGPDGKPRQPSATEPKSAGGDGRRDTFALKYDADKQTASGEFPFPDTGPGRVVWLQPRYLNGEGHDQWSQAIPYAPDGPPVARTPVKLAFQQNKANAERTLELTSKSAFHWQLLEKLYNEGYPLHAKLTEKTLSLRGASPMALAQRGLRSPPPGGTLVELTYTDLALDLAIETGSAQLDSDLRAAVRGVITNLIKDVTTYVTVTRNGLMKDPKSDFRAAQAGMALAPLPKFNQQIIQSLTALNIPLPNETVPYGHTWEHPTNLFIETRDRYEAALFKMKLKYVGVRDRGGRQEAVIEIEGNLANDPSLKSIDAKDLKDATPPPAGGGAPPDPGSGGGAGGGGGSSGGGTLLRQTTQPKAPPAAKKGLYGLAKGYAFVDVTSGFVTEVKLFIDLDAEITVKDPDSKSDVPVMASGTMDLLLRRLGK